MAPPRELIQVEWMAARDWERPLDRRPRERRFTKEAAAAAQILAIRAMPTHLELVAVYRTAPGRGVDLDWERVDPDSLVPDPQDLARYASLREGWRSNPTVVAMAERVAGLNAQESYA